MWPHWVNPFAWWQWLIVALVPPAIIALYFLKLKRRPIEVPSTYLWRKSIEDLHVNSIWQRLRRNLLLFLQLLVLLFLFFAVLQPGWQSKKLPGNRYIFLIDNSASMQAIDVKPTRLDEAKRQALEQIDQMASGDVGMVVSFSDVARVEHGFTDSRRQLRRAVESIQSSVRTTSLAEALRVASGLANPPRISADDRDVQVAEALPATLIVLSDGKFEDVSDVPLGNLTPHYLAVGSPEAVNVGIVNMSVRRHETRTDQLEAFARIQNFSHKPASISLEWLLNGEQIDFNRMEIPAEGTQTAIRSLAGLNSGKLLLRLTTHDDLPLDDEAWAAISPPRQARVLLVTPADDWRRRLELALTTGPAKEIAQVTVEGPKFLEGETYQQQAAIGAYDLIVYDRCQPKEMPRANTFFLGIVPPGGAWGVRAEVRQPNIIDIDPTHPLMQWINLGNLLIANAISPKPPAGGRVLIDSDGGPLLAVAPRESFEDAVLGFSIVHTRDGETLVNTDWYRHSTFPTFVYNLLQYLGGGKNAQEGESLRPGQQATLDSPMPGKPLRVQTPSGRVVRLTEGKSGKFTFTDTSELGIYETSVDGKNVQQFAVNLFHAAESDIATRPEVQIAHESYSAQAAAEAARIEIWKGLLLGGLVVLLLEWYIYNRRVSL